MKCLFKSPEGDALNKMFDLASKFERDKRKLENTLDNVKKLLLKGKADDALQLILREEKQ